jgi:hypothetical protein
LESIAPPQAARRRREARGRSLVVVRVMVFLRGRGTARIR